MRLGLIGYNGSEKSTLLRTITGIYEPTPGQIEIQGKLTPILDIMKVRLAFSISNSMPNNILVIDKVFGAADKNFIEKATKRMMNMINTSNIVIFTSHDLNLIRSFCTHILWLDAGKVEFFGNINEGIDKYLKT